MRAEQNPCLGHAGPPSQPAGVLAVPRVEFPGKGASVSLELTPKVPSSLEQPESDLENTPYFSFPQSAGTEKDTFFSTEGHH